MAAGPSPSMGQRRQVPVSTGMNSVSAPTRRGVSVALHRRGEGVRLQVGREGGAGERGHAGAPSTRPNGVAGSLRPGLDPESGRVEQRGHALAVVLGADLGADGFARRECDRLEPGDRDDLVAGRDQVHLDPVGHRVVEGAMLEGVADRSRRPSSWFSTSSMFRLNSAVTPWLSLYAASIRAMSFRRSTPIRNRSPGSIAARTRASSRMAAGG